MLVFTMNLNSKKVNVSDDMRSDVDMNSPIGVRD